MRTVYEPGQIIRFHYKPSHLAGVGPYWTEALVIQTKITKKGVVKYWVSLPESEDDDGPSGGSVPGVTEDQIAGPSHSVDYLFTRDRPEIGRG